MIETLQKGVTPRRDFIKNAGAAIVAAALPALPLSLVAFPKAARAEPITVALAVVGAISSLMAARKGGGMNKRLAALDLKLDQVLNNQITILNAIGVLQHSIVDLQKKIPGLLTNKDYGQMLKQSLSSFRAITNINQRLDPVEQKIADHRRELQKLYDGINDALSLVDTSTTGVEGIASILSAGQAVILYLDALYSVTNFEMNVPPKERWKNAHAAKLSEMSDMYREMLQKLSDRRIPEAIKEQKEASAREYKEVDKDYWGTAFGSMALDEINAGQNIVDDGLPKSRVKSLCFRSRVTIYGFMAVTQTFDVSVSYKAKKVSPGKPNLVLYDFQAVPEKWKVGTFIFKRDSEWVPNDENARNSKWNRDGKDSSSCPVITRDGNADDVRAEIIPAEFASFQRATEMAAQSDINVKILQDIIDMCRMLDKEAAEFKKNLEKKTAPEISLFEKLREWLP